MRLLYICPNFKKIFFRFAEESIPTGKPQLLPSRFLFCTQAQSCVPPRPRPEQSVLSGLTSAPAPIPPAEICIISAICTILPS